MSSSLPNYGEEFWSLKGYLGADDVGKRGKPLKIEPVEGDGYRIEFVTHEHLRLIYELPFDSDKAQAVLDAAGLPYKASFVPHERKSSESVRNRPSPRLPSLLRTLALLGPS